MDLEVSPTPTTDDLTDPREFERSQMPDREEIVVGSTGGLDFRPEPAGLLRRLIGFVVDQLVVLAALAPGVAIAVAGSGGAIVAVGVLVAIVGFVAAATWYGRAIAARGRWIGNRVTGTRVVDVRNGSHVAVGHGVTRFLVRHLGAILILPSAVMLTDSQRRTFHDRLVGTVVVGRERQAWSVDDEPGPPTAPR
ncbi:MAG: RDD family protein [Actinomycetota bacterium]